MSKVFLFIFMLFTFLNANVILQPSYCVKTNKIHKSFFTKEKQDTKLLFKLPKNFKTFAVPTIKISREFVNVEDKTKGIIKFKRCTNKKNNLSFIRHIFIKHIKKTYPNIKIKSLVIKQLSKIVVKDAIKIKLRNLGNRGVFSVVSLNSKEVKFRYELNALISAYSAKKEIQKGRRIEHFDIKKIYVDFKNHNRIVSSSYILSKVAKIKISKDRTILKHMLKKEILISRGDEVTAIYQDGAIEINLNVVALKDGSLNEKITIKTKDGKILKALILNSKILKIL